jgi:hypothetical protein
MWKWSDCHPTVQQEREARRPPFFMGIQFLRTQSMRTTTSLVTVPRAST